MNSYAISGLINTITVSILGITVYLKGRKSETNIKYSLFCFFVALWCYNYFLWQITDSQANALFYCRGLMAGAIFIPVCFLDFVVTLLGIRRQKKIIVHAGYIIFFAFFISNFTPFFIKGVSAKLGFPYWPEPGSLFTPFLIIWLGYCIYPCCLLFQGYRSEAGLKRNQIKYVLLGIIIGYISGSTNYFLWYNIAIPPVGNYVVPLFVTTMAFSIIRYRLMDINIAIRKVITNFIITTIIALGIICIAVIPISTTVICTAAFLLAIFLTTYLPRIKIKTESTVNHILYREKYNYQNTLETFIEKMVLIPKKEDLFRETVSNIATILGVEKVAVLILDPISNNFILNDQIGLDTKEELKILGNQELILWLKKNNDVLVKEEIEKILVKDEISSIDEALKPLEASICIPAMLGNDLIGIITLGEKTSGEMYSHVDTAILKRLGTQLAIALDYRRIEAELRTEDRLAAMGTMSMEIGHEMRNLLTAPYTFIDMLLDRLNDPEFMGSFRELAMDRLRVIRGKLDDIMYFGKEHEVNLKPGVDIQKLIDDTLVANEYSIKNNQIEVIKQYDSIPAIKADHDHLVHLINNLILNAIDAMSAEDRTGKKLQVRTKVNNSINNEMRERSEQWIRVEVKDDGGGIPEHILKKLFTPFVTTKSGGGIQRRGTGLGLSVVKKAVDAHLGYIYVHSKEGKGTTMIVDLPANLKMDKVVLEGFQADKDKEPWE